MLPDFASMAGARMALAPPAALATARPALAALLRGIELHHRTDHEFHGCAAFIALMQLTVDRLTAGAVPRGSARAVAHVGVEMLLDGEIVQDPAVATAYEAALNAGDVLDARLFRDAEGAARFGILQQRLIAHGVPREYRDPNSVADRLQRVLSVRPRLALTLEAGVVVRRVLAEVQPAVQARVGEILGVLAAALDPREAAGSVTH
jgi:hypothetical protein